MHQREDHRKDKICCLGIFKTLRTILHICHRTYIQVVSQIKDCALRSFSGNNAPQTRFTESRIKW